MRDEFPKSLKKILGERAGHKCSNPGCRRSTVGPGFLPMLSINLGVASHITGASQNGPRFDPSLTSEMRSSIGNAVWLCQACSVLVDKDEKRYPPWVLHQWKTEAESQAFLELSHRIPPTVSTIPVDLRATLLFPYVAVLGHNPHWRESFEPVGKHRFSRLAWKHFYLETFATNAEPSFDVVCYNVHDEPLVISEIGVQIEEVSQINYAYGIAGQVTLCKGPTYVIEMPNLWPQLGRQPDSPRPEILAKVQITAKHLLDDVIFLGPNVPFRFGLYLKDYIRNLPNGALFRIYAKTTAGEASSGIIYAFTL